MGTKRISLDQLPGELRRLRTGFRAEIRRAVGRAASQGLRLVRKKTPRDTGELRESGEVRRYAVGDEAARIVFDAPHAGIVEVGVGPHKVSASEAAALREWAGRHFSKIAGKRLYLRGKRKDAAIQNLVAKMVNKLETRGHKPSYFVRRSIPAVAAEVRQTLARAVADFAGKVR